MNLKVRYNSKGLNFRIHPFFYALFLLLVLPGFTFCQQFVDSAFPLGVNSVQSIDDDLANGLSFYDFDQDGWDDLTIPAGTDSIITYRNIGGTFQEIDLLSVATGNVRQVLWVDYDNDSDPDLFLSYYNIGVRLYENDGALNFTDVTQQVGISAQPFRAYGVAFADPDGDFDLDIYICAYTLDSSAPNALVNFYYQNDGSNYFTNVSSGLGIDNGYQPTFMPVWYDVELDGDVDLHVINDREFTNDALYINNGSGQFVNQAATLGISNDDHSPMSCTIGDFNNDGYFDVFESDVANGAIENGLLTDYKIFQNNSGTSFTNVAPNFGVDTNFFGWGGLWVDYDNDCFEDLYIATAENDLTGLTEHISLLYKNLGGLGFALANDSIVGNITQASYSPVKGDLDNNGYYDIVVLNGMNQPHNVLLNQGGSNNFIKITPYGSISNAQALGGRVEVFANGQHQSKMILSSDGMCAQNSQHLIFGLGSATVIDSVHITFPSGLVSSQYNIAANQSISIYEVASVQVNAGASYTEACNGDTIELTYPGLTNFEWQDGSTNSSFFVTQSGTYSFTAENNSGDTVYFGTPMIFDFETTPTVSSYVADNPCGADSLGAIELYCVPQQVISSVLWSNGEQSMQLDSLPTGTYSYLLTSNFGCIYEDSLSVLQEPNFNVTFVSSSYTDTSFGSVELYVWGGVSPYTFLLDTVNIGNALYGLPPGTYFIQVIDANDCTELVEITIANESTAGTKLDETIEVWMYEDGNQIAIHQENIRAENIHVYDLTGKKIRTSVINKTQKLLVLEVHAAPGIYQVYTQFGTALIAIGNP